MATDFDIVSNFIYGTVLTAPSPATSGTTLTLQSGWEQFPDPGASGGYNILLYPPRTGALSSNAEIVRLTGAAGPVLTFIRAQEGTTAKTVVGSSDTDPETTSAWQVAFPPTAKAITDLQDAINEPSGVTPGSYTSANITVDAQGKVTAAANGSGGGGSGTVTTVSVTTANGVSGSVANATTTPAITLALGAIVPSSVNSVVISGSSTPTLAVTGTTTVSGANTGDQTSVSGNAGTATALQTGRTISLTGDVTATTASFDGTGNATAAATIANDAVTYAKMQNVSAASKLIGRGSAAGAGNPEEITVGSGLSMTGTTLSATGGGGGSTAIARTAWVEVAGNDSTGVIGDITKPYQTIDGALAALGTSSTTCKILRIGVGRFAPISGAVVGTNSGPNYAATSIIYDNTKFIGSGCPRIAAGSLALEDGSGTIIDGPWGLDNNGITIQDLGIDAGTTVVTARYTGAAQDALLMFNQGQVASPGTKPPRTGCMVQNVVGLCKDISCLFHGALFENLDNADISNIQTCYGVHGIVFKTINTTACGLRADSHGWDALIIKSNTYAPCYNNAISDVVMTSVATAGGEGLRFDCADASAPDLFDCVVTGIIAQNVTTAVQWGAGGAGTLKNCRVDGLIMSGVTNTFTTFGALENWTLLINGTSLRTAPTLINSWANSGGGNAPAEWWLENTTLVVDGVITGGTVPAYAFMLPAGVGPATAKRYPIACYSGTFNLGDIAINSSGVYFESGSVIGGGSFASIGGSVPVP